MQKLKWKVGDPPTGKFRSFHKRGWPDATLVGTDHPMASIECEDSYTPAKARDGDHKPLTVRIADWTPPEPGAARWKWRKLKGEFATLDHAKAAALQVLLNNPGFWPTEDAK